MKANKLSNLDFNTRKIDIEGLAVRFPLLFAFASTLVAMLCLMWPLWIPGFSQASQILWGRAAICLFAVFMLTYLGWWHETGFTRPTSWCILVPYLPVILLTVAVKTFDVATVGIHVFDARKQVLLRLVRNERIRG